MFEGFAFPDGAQMQWESVSWLQKFFMEWFNKERTKSSLTFPVESLSLLNDNEDAIDQIWLDHAAEMLEKGHSFFIYTSNSVDSLSSCCRLRNGITDNTFSYTLGAGGIATGSKCVMTMNVNRLIQDAMVTINYNKHKENGTDCAVYEYKDIIQDAITEQVEKMHKYLLAFNSILLEMNSNHMIPIYEAGFVNPEKQYLTIGIVMPNTILPIILGCQGALTRKPDLRNKKVISWEVLNEVDLYNKKYD